MLAGLQANLPSATGGDVVLVLRAIAGLGHICTYAFLETVVEEWMPRELRRFTAKELATVRRWWEGRESEFLTQMAARSVDARCTQPPAKHRSARHGTPRTQPGPPQPGLLASVQLSLSLSLHGEGAFTSWATACPSTSQVAWSLARLHHRPSPEFMRALLDAAEPQLGAATVDSITAFVWAVAELSPDDDDEAEAAPGGGAIRRFLSAACDEVAPRLSEFAPRNLVSFLAALAR